MKIKGVYKFICEELDIEETVVFEGRHTWADIDIRFVLWLTEKTVARVEEISYEEKA